MMKEGIFYVLIFINILVGCSKGYKIEPNELLNARVGQPYQQSLIISGGKVIDKDNLSSTEIPENLGITVQPVNDLDGYNIIEIKGTPKYKGIFKIHVLAGFYGGGRAEINKEYTLTVED